MRDLDKRDLITGDFVLVCGDVIANVNLDHAIVKHRARREKDKSRIMTMVLRAAGRDQRSKPLSKKPLFFIDPQQDRCLFYDEVSKRNRGDGRFHLDPDLLSQPEIDIRGDLIDCYVDICTPEVLSLWSDNFDYKSIRTSFLKGVLQDYELNQKTIHTHVFEEGYMARVSSLRAYEAVTKDIVSRWTYPFTPDCNLLRDHNYHLGKNRVYTEAGVVLARGSIVKARSIIGKETSVGDGSIISDSVLGRRCQIGRNVKIQNSYIWDDVVIGDNSVITSAIIANEVVIGADCKLEEDALLSFRVRLSKGITLPPKTRLTHSREASSPASPPRDASIVGIEGAGRAYDSDSDTSIASNSLLRRSSSASSLASISTLHSELSSLSIPRSGSIYSIPSTDDPSHSSRANDAFLNEAITSIQDGIQKGDDPDTVKLELLGQRLTQDASDTDMRDAIARALIRSVFALINPVSTTSSKEILSSSPTATLGGSRVTTEALLPKEATRRVFETYSPVLTQLGLFDSDSEDKKDQVAVLKEIERECAARLADGSAPGDKVLLFALNELHESQEVVQDEGVVQWWDDGVEDDKVRSLAKTYVKYVREAAEESEESSEEEDDDDDEDDEH